MEEILEFGKYRIARKELTGCSYKCDPALCTGHVCCGIFDIAITFSEREKITSLLPELTAFCPWLAGNPDIFKITPCEIFIAKRENNMCIFNWEDTEGRAWCAIHTLALKKGLNPFQTKPLNCSMWPFLRDGNDRLELDKDTTAPCLKFHSEPQEADPELLQMLDHITKLKHMNKEETSPKSKNQP